MSIDMIHEKAERFKDYGVTRGYALQPDTPLIDAPSSIQVMNSTIANYVDLINEDGIDMELDDCRTQTCVRFRSLGGIALNGLEWTTTFTMGGLISNRRGFEEVTTDILDFIDQEYDLGRDKLSWTYHADYPEEREGLLASGLDESRSEAVKANSHVWVDWQFGTPGPKGHGITLLAPESATGELLQCCNVITIDQFKRLDGSVVSLERPIYEVGFGVGRLGLVAAGLRYPFEHPPYSTLADSIESQITDPLHRASIADYVVTLNEMIGQGIQPGPKGAQSMVRRIVRNVYNIAYVNGTPLDDIAKLLDSRVKPTVEAEFTTYSKSIDRGIAKLQSMYADKPINNAQEVVDTFKSTYGLPDDITRAWLAKRVTR